AFGTANFKRINNLDYSHEVQSSLISDSNKSTVNCLDHLVLSVAMALYANWSDRIDSTASASVWRFIESKTPRLPKSSMNGTHDTAVASGTHPQNIPSAMALGQPSLCE